MDKGEKDDPGSPTRNNLFENAAANLLGKTLKRVEKVSEFIDCFVNMSQDRIF